MSLKPLPRLLDSAAQDKLPGFVGQRVTVASVDNRCHHNTGVQYGAVLRSFAA
jgi:hypothetical protein